MDNDHKIGILKLVYDTESNIPVNLRDIRFVMWQDDFKTSNVSVGEVHLNSMSEMQDFFISRGIANERFILLRTKVNKTDISITDEFEGVFLQEGFYSILSKYGQSI